MVFFSERIISTFQWLCSFLFRHQDKNETKSITYEKFQFHMKDLKKNQKDVYCNVRQRLVQEFMSKFLNTTYSQFFEFYSENKIGNKKIHGLVEIVQSEASFRSIKIANDVAAVIIKYIDEIVPPM